VSPTVKQLIGPLYPYLPTSKSTSDSSFDPAVSVEWRPVDGALWYLSYRQGFKAGGIDVDASSPVESDLLFDPETVDYYEAGAKYTFLGGAARFNVAVFRGDYDDLQVTQLDAETGNFRVLNAAEARSQGVDLDGGYAFNENVTLTAAVSYLDSEYLSFPGAQCWQNPAQTAAQGCVQIGTLPSGAPIFGQDLSGASTSFAPELSGTLGINFDYPTDWNWFGDGVSLRARAQVFYTDEFNTNFDADPLTAQDNFYKIDARLAVGGTTGGWELALIGRNLNDELTSHWIANTPGGGLSKFAQTDRPRELAIQLRINF
jgi:outer membrane receptor protein involved in Fe transport